MAIPTISTITPNEGHTGGRTLVVVTGTNFRTAPPPPPVGRVPDPTDTVRILFDGEPATDVEVFSDTELQCLTPAVRTAHQMGVQLPAYNPEQLVAVEVTNMADDGTAIAGETVTSAGAFQYRLPNPALQSLAAKVVRALIQDIVRQIHPNVAFTTNTDYDPATGDLLQLVALPSLPAILISELSIVSARGRQERTPEEVQDGTDRFVVRRAPRIVDFTFTLTAVSDDTTEVLNLGQMMIMYFEKNAKLGVPRTSEPTAKIIKYPMRMVGDASTAAVTNMGDGSNVEAITLQAIITDVRLEDFPGLPTAGVPGLVGSHEATVGWGYRSDEVVIDKLDLDGD